MTPTTRTSISILTPSKGPDLLSYIAPDSRTKSYSIKFEVPGKSLINTRSESFSGKLLDIAIAGSRSFVGRFQRTALRNGEEVASGWNDVNALTGNLDGRGPPNLNTYHHSVLAQILTCLKSSLLLRQHHVSLQPKHQWTDQACPGSKTIHSTLCKPRRPSLS